MKCLAILLVAVSMGVGQQVRPDASQARILPGRVLHDDLPVPGATVTATNGDRTQTTTSDENGVFGFADLEPGVWTIKVEMRGFATAVRQLTVPPSGPELAMTLTMRTFAEVIGERAVKSSWPTVAAAPGAWPLAVAADPVEILNGSVTNGAATPFAQPRTAGNNRPKSLPLYSGELTGNFGNWAWNAPSYSFGGPSAPAAHYGDAQFGLLVSGPPRIPFTRRWGPQTRVFYQHSVQHTATTQTALVPTFEERRGDLSDRAGVIRDPLTGLPFAGNVIPDDRVAHQATALLAFYPMPMGATSTGANFQRQVVNTSTSDRLQIDSSKSFGRTQIAGSVSVQRSTTDTGSIFDFIDNSRQSSTSASASWTRRLGTRMNARANYQFTASENATTPFFANRANVSGDAGIAGNAQDPANWGPPTIVFPGFTALSDGGYQHTTRQAHVIGGEIQRRQRRHNLTLGGDARLYAITLLTQPDARGTLAFTGAATGDALAGFLLGIPTTSAIAFGGTSAHVRGGSYDAYIDDDFRVAPGLTFDMGLRWEYESPYTERDGRVANLDVAPGFAGVATVVGADPTGALTGTRYPSSLVRPDRRGLEPRISVAWRPLLASSLVIKAGYGLSRNVGVYQSVGTLLAQQPPYGSAYAVQNMKVTPLTLANPFPASQPSTTTFAVDPDFRTAQLRSWQVTVQRDSPGSLTVVAAYYGGRGTHLTQAFLPNTYAPGAPNPCPVCPSGFLYLTSGGTSMRNAAQVILRRRLYAGFTSSIAYTLAKATDDASTLSNTSVAPGSLQVAQNWLDLSAERGPSSFDQRHLVSADVQYTTGVGLAGGTLVDAIWGKLYKDWTVTGQLNAGNGMPLTPLVFVAVPGTGVVGIRPSLTGQPVGPQQGGSYANPAAFAVPAPGTWGDTGRNSIRGPATFSLDMAVSRTFRFTRHFNLDWRISATNVLNRVTFTTIDRSITSPQFGRPTNANSMRRILTNFVFRF